MFVLLLAALCSQTEGILEIVNCLQVSFFVGLVEPVFIDS